jgi:DUF4097 and DUF4098 domain-containing protein YvlB
MKKQLLLPLLLVLNACAAVAFAEANVDETKTADADGYVQVKIVRGEVTVEGWDRNEVSVEGSLDEAMEKFIFDVRGKETVIAVRLPNRLDRWCCDRETDLKIRVPKNSDVLISLTSAEASVRNVHGGLEIGGVSGGLRIEDVSDRVRITNISGEVTLRGADGRVRIKTISGDINANDIKGPGTFNSVSGSIEVANVNDELDLETVSGDIEVQRSEVSAVRANTVSGDIEVETRLRKGGLIETDTMSGSVRLALQGKVDARFDLETHSGRIRNRLSDHKPKESKYVRDEVLRFTLGDGSGEVNASSASGDISISKN